MKFYPIVFYIVAILFPLLGVAKRAHRLRLVAQWIAIDGTIIGCEHRLTGESALVYIDVKYTFEGIDRFGFDLRTNALTSKGFEIGRKVKILINPAKSYDCQIAGSACGDAVLQRLFKIPAARDKS